MEYILTKGRELTEDALGIETETWFNMWANRLAPYNELAIGDVIYWYDTKTQSLLWKTITVDVKRRPYSDKKSIYDMYRAHMTDEYYSSRAEMGFFFHYEVKVLERINIPKPVDFNFQKNRHGWVTVNDKISKQWFDRNVIEDDNILDDNSQEENLSIREQLEAIDIKMQYMSPERITKIISTTIRKDTQIIKALKKAYNHACQFPGCGHQIKKKNGGFYIEVAHIEPIAKNGKSILGNLIVLCPNHHKELDHGNLLIAEQSKGKISGKLNGREFEIDLSI